LGRAELYRHLQPSRTIDFEKGEELPETVFYLIDDHVLFHFFAYNIIKVTSLHLFQMMKRH
jgi:hypothetical protein